MAKQRGLEEGFKLGLGQGLEKGIFVAKQKTARNLLDLGMDIALIMLATGLT